MANRLVVGGGADRGVVSAAGISAIYYEKIPIDSIFATSVGILNSIAYISGVVEDLEWVYKDKLDVKRDLQKVNKSGLVKGMVIYSSSLFKDTFLKELVKTYVSEEYYGKIISSKIDFEFPVLNLTEGGVEFVSNRACLDIRDYRKFVLAGISVPALSPAVKIGNTWYADAGFIDNAGLMGALKMVKSDDKIIVLHNFPREPIAIDWEYGGFGGWRKTLWRATELKQTILADRDANLYDALLKTRDNVVGFLGENLPNKLLFKKIRKKTLSGVGEIFNNMPLAAGSSALVKKKVDIFPPSSLSIFKNATPGKKALIEAFNEMLVLSKEILRKEFLGQNP